jgi:hypothetical protein
MNNVFVIGVLLFVVTSQQVWAQGAAEAKAMGLGYAVAKDSIDTRAGLKILDEQSIAATYKLSLSSPSAGNSGKDAGYYYPSIRFTLTCPFSVIDEVTGIPTLSGSKTHLSQWVSGDWNTAEAELNTVARLIKGLNDEAKKLDLGSCNFQLQPCIFYGRLGEFIACSSLISMKRLSEKQPISTKITKTKTSESFVLEISAK